MQMKGVFQEVLQEAKARATKDLELEGSETVWLDEIFSSEVSYPLELDLRALRSFEQDLRSRMEGRGLKAKRELARSLGGRRIGRKLWSMLSWSLTRQCHWKLCAG